MDLKLQYAPLNKYQMDLVENRDKYEAKLRAVEEEYSGNAPELDDYDEGTPDSEASKQVAMQIHEDAQAKSWQTRCPDSLRKRDGLLLSRKTMTWVPQEPSLT